MLPYVAYLRAYEPLHAFSEPERSGWAAYTGSGDRPSRGATLDLEHERALRGILATPPVAVPERESAEAYIRQVGGVTYLCPWQTRLRSWLALMEFRGSIPDRVADAFLPKAAAEQAADYERSKRRHTTERPHILSGTWHVPLPWFVPFDPGERLLVLGDGKHGKHTRAATAAPTRTLIYVTSMTQARRRVARALAVIRRFLGEAGIYAGVEDIGRWLEEFHPKSLVELDYGGLVHLLDDGWLRADQSVADAAAALEALESGQDEVVSTIYGRLTTRWREVQRLEAAN